MKLKPLYNLSKQNKATYFSLLISDIHKKIDKVCENWFQEVFIEKKDYVGEDIYTSNLRMDLDYLFSEAIWMIGVAKMLKLDIRDVSSHTTWLYEIYTAKKDGHRDLVLNEAYDKKNHKVFTEEEVAIRKKKSNEIGMAIFKEILAEENAKKS